MTSSNRLPLFHLYVDDSGTRHPDHTAPTSASGDWFGLGGFLIKEEDEAHAKAMHSRFCEKWGISYPLHSVKIRHKSGNFAWLAQLNQAKLREFFSDLDEMMSEIPVICNACVIDRPGYYRRYFDRFGRQRWHLCKSAFSILAERTAKFATLHERRVKVFVEETDRASDRRILQYFREMRDSGMPFDRKNSDKYGPMSTEHLRFRLLDIAFKKKTSPMIQLADLLLYPMCRAPYDGLYAPMKTLRSKGRLIEAHLDESQREHMGIKLYCFE